MTFDDAASGGPGAASSGAALAAADPGAVEQAQKAEMVRYLTEARSALLWKLDGLSDYDIRRPLVPTGTNLLGLIKHVASVAAGYFGETFGRPFPEELPWFDDGAEANADMWATPEESREFIVGLWDRIWAHADEVIASLALTDTGAVPWWPEERRTVTLHRILIHMTAETDRHAGQADIVRELIDGAAGLRADNDNLPPAEAEWWASYRDRVQKAAESFK